MTLSPEEILSGVYYLKFGDIISLEESNERLMCSPFIEEIHSFKIGLDFTFFPEINCDGWNFYYGDGDFEEMMLLLELNFLRI